tara:strand:- start:17697 stop:19031 length:1335 start_codon:yes stop_codon:yes gene_type:complete
MAVQIQLRRGTASQWTSTNPTLAAGEIALETDTNKIKLGDGSTAWTSLAYAAFGDITGVDITAGDGLDISQSGTTAGNYTATVSADLKSNGGLVIESTEIAVKLDASSITGTLAIADGGTGSTSAGDARTALGLGTAAVLATGIANTNVPKFTSGVADDDFLRVIGTAIEGRSASELLSDIGAQAVDADLTAIAGLTSAADKGIQFTGSGSAAVYDLTAAGKALLDDADAAAQRTTLGLGTAALLATGISNTNVIQAGSAVSNNDFLRINGTTVRGRSASETLSDIGAQASDADLTAIAGLTSAADKGIQFTGSGSAAVYDLTAAGKALLDDADAAAQRTTLGVTNVGSYTGQIETVADKTYTLDPGAATARTISGFFIKSASGTVTAALKVGTAVVKSASVTDSTGDQSSLANTSVSANDVLTLVCSSNSSALDVIFAVEFTE